MIYLETRSGLIAEHAIDIISDVMHRSTGDVHEVEYHVGGEPRATYASADAVANYWRRQAK